MAANRWPWRGLTRWKRRTRGFGEAAALPAYRLLRKPESGMAMVRAPRRRHRAPSSIWAR